VDDADFPPLDATLLRKANEGVHMSEGTYGPTKFSVGHAIGYGWRKTWKNFWRFLLLGLIFLVISAISNAITGFGSFDMEMNNTETFDTAVFGQNTALSIIGTVLQYLVSAFLALGLIRVALAVTAGDDVQIARVFSFDGYGRYLLNAIIVSFVAVVAFAIIFVPTLLISLAADTPVFAIIGAVIGVVLLIIAVLGLSFFGYLIVDKEAPGITSLRGSWEIIRPHFGSLLGLYILLTLINVGLMIAAIVVGILLIFVGLLITIPIALVISFGLTSLAIAYAYRLMSGQEVAAL
jgi:hypothetical protein